MERVPRVVPQQTQSGDPRLQIGHELVEASTAHGQADGRVALLEHPDHGGQEGTGQGGEGADGQGAALEPGDVVQIGLGGVHLPHDPPGVVGQHLAGLGGHHPAGAAVQQRLADLLLELAQLLGHGRGRVHHQLGRRRDRALLDHLYQQGQAPHVEQMPSVVVKQQFILLWVGFIRYILALVLGNSAPTDRAERGVGRRNISSTSMI